MLSRVGCHIPHTQTCLPAGRTSPARRSPRVRCPFGGGCRTGERGEVEGDECDGLGSGAGPRRRVAALFFLFALLISTTQTRSPRIRLLPVTPTSRHSILLILTSSGDRISFHLVSGVALSKPCASEEAMARAGLKWRGGAERAVDGRAASRWRVRVVSRARDKGMAFVCGRELKRRMQKCCLHPNPTP